MFNIFIPASDGNEVLGIFCEITCKGFPYEGITEDGIMGSFQVRQAWKDSQQYFVAEKIPLGAVYYSLEISPGPDNNTLILAYPPFFKIKWTVHELVKAIRTFRDFIVHRDNDVLSSVEIDYENRSDDDPHDSPDIKLG